MAALQAAALRNVDVRILRPERADHILVKLSSFTFLRDLDTYGIQLWAYQKGFLHQKVVLMDDDIATVGTANLDNRSLALNFEITAVIHSPLRLRGGKSHAGAGFFLLQKGIPGGLQQQIPGLQNALQPGATDGPRPVVLPANPLLYA